LADLPILAFPPNSQIFSKFGNAAIFTKWLDEVSVFQQISTSTPFRLQLALEKKVKLQ